MIVEMACLYTSCECPSRRSSTQKLSNQVTTPCSFTPFTRKIVSGVLFLRTWLRKVSCRFCERSAAIVAVPSFFASRAPSREAYLPSRRAHFLTLYSHQYLISTWTLPLQGTPASGASTSWGQNPAGPA